MRISIEFDITNTEFPEEVSLATQNLLRASRGLAFLGKAPPYVAPTVTMQEPNLAATEEPEADTGETPQQVATRKRGRKSNAEKEAEAKEAAALATAVAEEVSAEPVPEAEKVVFSLPSGPAPAMFTAQPFNQSPPAGQAALNPAPQVLMGGMQPAFPPVTLVPPTPLVQQPAMPNAGGPVIGPDGNTLVDLQAIMSLANAKKAGCTFPILRRRNWLDGSPKDSWLVAEGVPAEHRERLMTEMAQEIGL